MPKLPTRRIQAAVAGLTLVLATSAVAAELQCTYPPRGREHEAAVIARNGVRAQRAGNTLRLMAGAQPVELEDNLCENEPVSDCIRFALVDYLAEHRQFVVQLLYWEGEAYWLVDAYSGERIGLEGYPWLSPDRSQFVTVTGGESDYVANGFEIWRISRFGLERQWWHRNTAKRGAPSYFCTMRWVDERHIALRAETLVDEPGVSNSGQPYIGTREVYTPATLTRTDQGWALHAEPP